ncbi:hypothetical protein [Asticcacaulis tiandongensis]|uniref:hypothetical protein n=1 Tax=Asticcacaulis tiandongensis TaxID=2565365 RepID=UPI001125B90D|nr:hypothetical protein [Asticcacaulis tiandongensis]
MRLILTLTGLLGFTACQSVAADQAAWLTPKADSLNDLKTALSQMMQTRHIDLGPSDPTQSTSLTVLPPPVSQHETRSAALPVRFDLILRDGKCYVVRHDTGDSRELPQGACVPAAD